LSREESIACLVFEDTSGGPEDEKRWKKTKQNATEHVILRVIGPSDSGSKSEAHAIDPVCAFNRNLLYFGPMPEFAWSLGCPKLPGRRPTDDDGFAKPARRITPGQN
jgi:hypothetical protein